MWGRGPALYKHNYNITGVMTVFGRLYLWVLFLGWRKDQTPHPRPGQGRRLRSPTRDESSLIIITNKISLIDSA